MKIYRGGQTVQKGTYWEPNRAARIVVKMRTSFPATEARPTSGFPELSADPPAVGRPRTVDGISLWHGVHALHLSHRSGGACFVAGSASLRIMKEMLGRTAVFGYALHDGVHDRYKEEELNIVLKEEEKEADNVLSTEADRRYRKACTGSPTRAPRSW